jgi:hypothetical protein
MRRNQNGKEGNVEIYREEKRYLRTQTGINEDKIESNLNKLKHLDHHCY